MSMGKWLKSGSPWTFGMTAGHLSLEGLGHEHG